MLLGTLNIGLSRSGRHPTLLPNSNLAHRISQAIRETSERTAVKHAPGLQTQVVAPRDMRGILARRFRRHSGTLAQLSVWLV
jgi:hypothetical protein